MLFPEWFFRAIVYASLVLTSASIVTLLVLIVKDSKSGKLW